MKIGDLPFSEQFRLVHGERWAIDVETRDNCFMVVGLAMYPYLDALGNWNIEIKRLNGQRDNRFILPQRAEVKLLDSEEIV